MQPKPKNARDRNAPTTKIKRPNTQMGRQDGFGSDQTSVLKSTLKGFWKRLHKEAV